MAPLKVIQHNVLSWTFQRRNELYNVYREEDPDVVLLNAHGRSNEQRKKIFGCDIYQKSETNRENDGAAIAVKKGIRHSVIDDLEESYLGCVIKTEQYDICIATGYQPPRRPAIPVENLLRIFRRNQPAVFVGDLNAKHTSFGNASTNIGGRIVKQIIDNGLVTHTPATNFDTWVSQIGRGKPDIILSNQHNIFNTVVSAGPQTMSDHVPIIIQMALSPIMMPFLPKFNFQKANWENFRMDLNTNEELGTDNAAVQTIERETERWF